MTGKVDGEKGWNEHWTMKDYIENAKKVRGRLARQVKARDFREIFRTLKGETVEFLEANGERQDAKELFSSGIDEIDKELLRGGNE